MQTEIAGGCACGSITYQCSTEPSFSVICQCRQCQRITGTGHAAQFAIEAKHSQINGQARFYELTSDSGNKVVSAFCGACGSPVYKTTSIMPDLIMFHAATLDDPDTYRPEMLVFSESGPAWDHVNPDIPRKG